MKSYPHFINKKLSYEQQVKQGLDYFFTAPHVEKNIYKILTKKYGGGMMLLEKLIRNYNMGKQINKLI